MRGGSASSWTSAPDCRIVYVDHDPLVLIHARALLTSTPQGKITYLDAELSEPDKILTHAARTLDLTQPVALLVQTLHHLLDDNHAHAILTRLLDALLTGWRRWWDAGMHCLWPLNAGDGAHEQVGDVELEACYAYPLQVERPWVRVGFVASVDGAVTVEGLAGGLSSAADRRVFNLLRSLADVVVVGANTVRKEGYRGVRLGAECQRQRLARGQAAVPPIAVVSVSCGFDADSPLFTDTEVPPLILTASCVPVQRRARLAKSGAAVLVLGSERVELSALLAELERRGLRRVLCEGGPQLHGDLIAADVVDELCLTVAPALAGGRAERVAVGPAPPGLRRMELASILAEHNQLFLRYIRPSSLREQKSLK